MDAKARRRLIDDTERWFVRRGLPHAIDDYSARDDVLTRTVPLLSLVLLAEVVTTTFGERFVGWGQAAAFLVAVAAVVGGVVTANTVRHRRALQLPDRIGWVELAVFVVVPAALALALDRSPAEAALVAVVNVGIIGLAFVFAYFGVLPMVVFGLRQVWRRLRTVLQLTARVLPLLLLFVTFVFLNAEMWQVANDFTPVAYAIVTGAVALTAFAFVAVRLPVELEQLASFESWREVCAIADRSGAPRLPRVDDRAGDGDHRVGPALALDRRDRRNVSVLLFVSYAVQVLLIGVIVAVSLVALGVLAIREATIRQWTVQESAELHALWRFRLGSGTHLLTWGHLAVSGFIAVFSMLQFAVQLLRDDEYRAEFAADVSGEIREVLAVQALYERVLAAG